MAFYFESVPPYTAPAGDVIPDDRPYNPVSQAQWLRWSRQSQGLGENPIAGALARAAGAAFKGVRIESQIAPTIDWTPSSGGSTEGEGIGAWFVKNVVKPKVTVYTSAGPVPVAVYGEPTTNYFPVIAFLGTALAAGAAYFIYKGVAAQMKGLR